MATGGSMSFPYELEHSQPVDEELRPSMSVVVIGSDNFRVRQKTMPDMALAARVREDMPLYNSAHVGGAAGAEPLGAGNLRNAIFDLRRNCAGVRLGGASSGDRTIGESENAGDRCAHGS